MWLTYTGQRMVGTEGLVLPVDLNGLSAIWVAFARYRDHCGHSLRRSVELVTRQRGMLNAIDKLNISYALFTKAFECFYASSDDAVDTLQSIESKMDFFELACRKDPTDVNVRQHYALMLRRERAYEQVLEQIDETGARASEPRCGLVDTQGTSSCATLQSISAHPSHTGSGQGGAKRISVSLSAEIPNDRDEYSTQGLADLYLDRAQRIAPRRRRTVH